jgi:hypothetical protein
VVVVVVMVVVVDCGGGGGGEEVVKGSTDGVCAVCCVLCAMRQVASQDFVYGGQEAKHDR